MPWPSEVPGRRESSMGHDLERESDRSPPTRRPRRRGRRAGITLLVVGLLLAGAVALAPTILSSPLAVSKIAGSIDRSVAGSVKIRSVSLSWFGGQRVDGLEVFDPAGRPVLKIKHVSAERSLWGLLVSVLSGDIGAVKVRGLAADLAFDESGRSNLQRSLAATRQRPEPKAGGWAAVFVPRAFAVELTDARLSVTAPHSPPAVFENLRAGASVAGSTGSVAFDLSGRSRQGELAGDFSVEGRLEHLLGPHGRLTADRALGAIRARMTGLPVPGVDRLLGMNGLLAAALGDRLDLTADADVGAATQRVTATVRAPNLTADLDGRIADGTFALTKPAAIRLVATGKLVERLTASSDATGRLRLSEAVPLRLDVEALRTGLAGFEPATLAVRATLKAERPARLTGDPAIGDLLIRGLEARLETADAARSLAVALTAAIAQDGQPGKVEADAKLGDLFTKSGGLQLDKLRADATLRVTNLPVALVDRIGRQRGLLVDALGPQLSVTATARSTGGRETEAKLEIKTARLSADAPLRITDRVEATGPITIDYQLSSRLAARYLPENAGVTLRPETPIRVRLARFSAPLPESGKPALQPGKTAVHADLEVGAVSVSPRGMTERVTLDGIAVRLRGASLAAVEASATAKAVVAGKPGPLREALGERADLSARLLGSLGPQPVFTARDLTLDVSSDRLKARLPLTLSAARTLSLAQPATIDLTVTPDLMAELGLATRPTLAGPTPVHIEINRLSAALTPFDPATVRTAMAAKVTKVELAGDDRVRGASLTDIAAALELDGPAGMASARLDGKASLSRQGTPSPLLATVKLSRLVRDGRLDPGRAAIDAAAKLDRFPTAFLGAFSGARVPLVPLVGPTLQLDAALTLSGGATQGGVVDVKATSQNLAVDAGLKLGNAIELRRPAKVKLVVTPEAYAALAAPAAARAPAAAGRPGYALAAPVTIDAELRVLTWPMGGDGRKTFDPSRASVDLTFGASRIALQDRASSRGVTLTDLSGAVKAASLAGPITLRLTGKSGLTSPQAGAAPAAGTLRVSGDVRDLFNARGELDASGLSTDLSAELQQFPVAPIDAWLGQDGLLPATLGPTTDLTARAQLKQMSGPVTLRATAAHAKASMDGRLQSGILTLARPLVAEVEVTEALGRRALSRIHPIFETASTGEKPIRLEISDQGTRIPIAGFDARQVVIERARLDLGKIELKTGGLLSGVVGLAQRLGRWRTTSRESMTAWFTPLLWEMRDGRIRYTRRLDLLLDGSQHLATWGTVDQANDRANLVLAIMPVTLDKIFNLENVGPNDAFTIPITGSISSPKTDWVRAALDMGRLQAQSRLAGKRRGGELGALLGGLAKGALGGGAGGLSRGGIPPPSVDPLPWSTAETRGAAPREGPRQPAAGQEPGATQAPSPTREPPKKPEEQIEETIRKGLKGIFK